MSDMSIRLELDNSQLVVNAMKKQVQTVMAAWGTIAEGYAKEDATVDTGRLRNSITWAIKEKQSRPNTNKHQSGPADAHPADYKMLGVPSEAEVYVGTNVEYATTQELRDVTHATGKAHFLRDAVTKHIKEYEAAMEAALKK